jgi:ethanolamine utilization protein EutQ (cupin superfamily)
MPPIFIPKPTEIQAAGNKPKLIREYIGRVNSQTSDASIAYMKSPSDWIEPGQTPEFDEYTLVLKGLLCVSWKDDTFDLSAGQVLIAKKGEWVQYSTPHPDGAEYLAICIPAFSPQIVHRDS